MSGKFKNPVIEKISKILGNSPLKEASSRFKPTELATAALLLEAAVVDGSIGDLEKDRIAMLLARKFSLSSSDAVKLIITTVNIMKETPDFKIYTRQVNKENSLKDRLDIMDMLWQVTYADGVAHDFEIKIVYQVADMLHISDEQNKVAWQSAMDKLLNGPVPPSVSLPTAAPKNETA